MSTCETFARHLREICEYLRSGDSQVIASDSQISLCPFIPYLRPTLTLTHCFHASGIKEHNSHLMGHPLHLLQQFSKSLNCFPVSHNCLLVDSGCFITTFLLHTSLSSSPNLTQLNFHSSPSAHFFTSLCDFRVGHPDQTHIFSSFLFLSFLLLFPYFQDHICRVFSAYIFVSLSNFSHLSRLPESLSSHHNIFKCSDIITVLFHFFISTFNS